MSMCLSVQLMWLLGPRGIPADWRHMEGFGVHTFKMVNKAGKETYVKFHWKPTCGVKVLTDEEAKQVGEANNVQSHATEDLWNFIEDGKPFKLFTCCLLISGQTTRSMFALKSSKESCYSCLTAACATGLLQVSWLPLKPFRNPLSLLFYVTSLHACSSCLILYVACMSASVCCLNLLLMLVSHVTVYAPSFPMLLHAF